MDSPQHIDPRDYYDPRHSPKNPSEWFARFADGYVREKNTPHTPRHSEAHRAEMAA